MARGLSHHYQSRWWPRKKGAPGPRRVWLDSTGAGDAAGQLLARHLDLHGPLAPARPERMRQAFKLQQQPLTPALQNELFPQLQATLQSGRVLLPHHPCVLEELPSLQAIVSENHQVDYRSNRMSNAEYPAALALAVRAALDHEFYPHACATSVDVPSRRRYGI